MGAGEPDEGQNQTFSSRPFSPLQRGDSYVTEDCSQRCTCASSGVLLCEPLRCHAGEICTLGNLTRGCFRGEPRPPLGFKLPPCGGGGKSGKEDRPSQSSMSGGWLSSHSLLFWEGQRERICVQ